MAVLMGAPHDGGQVGEGLAAADPERELRAELARVRILLTERTAELARVWQQRNEFEREANDFAGQLEQLRARSPEEHIWLGDLSGYQVTEITDRDVTVRHRCGWTATSLPYLGNIVEATRQHTDCRPYQRNRPLSEILADARAEEADV